MAVGGARMNEKPFPKPGREGVSPDASLTEHGQTGAAVVADDLAAQQAMRVLLDLARSGFSGREADHAPQQVAAHPLILLSARDVVAQIQSLMRHDPVPCAALHLDEAAWRAEIAGQDLRLTAIEFQLLRLMARAPQRLFTRSQLISGIYQDGRVVSERTIDSHIRKIRRKMEAIAPDLALIETMYGVGYRFIGKASPY